MREFQNLHKKKISFIRYIIRKFFRLSELNKFVQIFQYDEIPVQTCNILKVIIDKYTNSTKSNNNNKKNTLEIYFDFTFDSYLMCMRT